MNNLKLSMEAFNRMFNRTNKVVTFNTHWKAGVHSVGGAVSNTDYRLILPHGEIAKCHDDFGRRVLLIGTMYGLISINETFFKSSDPHQPLHYTTTPALVAIWESYYHVHFPVSDYAHAPNVPGIMTDAFLAQVADIAAQEVGYGRTPGDGMRQYIVGKNKERRDDKNSKPSHGRRHNDTSKSKAFKQQKEKVKQEAAVASAPQAEKRQGAAKPARKKKPARVQQNVIAKKEVLKAIEEIAPEVPGSIIQQDMAKRQSQALPV